MCQQILTVQMLITYTSIRMRQRHWESMDWVKQKRGNVVWRFVQSHVARHRRECVVSIKGIRYVEDSARLTQSTHRPGNGAINREVVDDVLRTFHNHVLVVIMWNIGRTWVAVDGRNVLVKDATIIMDMDMTITMDVVGGVTNVMGVTMMVSTMDPGIAEDLC
jgi:hypothetical protein